MRSPRRLYISPARDDGSYLYSQNPLNDSSDPYTMTIPDSSELTPSLISQAQTILEAATSLQQQLDSAALRQPSFAPSGRRNWFDAGHLPQLLETRLKLLDAAQSMLDLVMGPWTQSRTLRGLLRRDLRSFGPWIS